MQTDQATALHHPAADEMRLPAVLHALSDPQRLHIIAALAAADEPRACGSIELNVAKSTMTHHFRVLREAGLIRQERVGTTKLTSLRREDLEARFPGLLDAVLGSSVPA